MAVRVVNGNDHTEDGWPLVDQAGCTWIVVPGTSVSLQIQSGVPARVLGAWVADWNAYVEPVYDADSASWTAGNSVLGQPGRNNGSNHLGGTAVDVRWQSHPWKVRNGGLNAAQLSTIREMVDWYEGCIWWGGDWPDAYVDPMHSQLGGLSSGDVATYSNGGPTPHIIDFIARKIRADGFSTFRRGNAPGPVPVPAPVSRADGYAIKIIQEGQRIGITPRGIQIALSVALVETNLTMYANSNDPPSLNFPHDAVGSDHMSSGLFQQQTAWGSLADRMDPTQSANIFFTVDHGGGVRGLTKIRDGNGNLYDYNDTSKSPGFYAQKVQGSAFPDRYDQRMGDAVALYNRLANSTVGVDDLSAEDSAKLDRILNYLEEPLKSRSAVRPPGQGTIGNLRDFVLWTNGSTDEAAVTALAREGEPGSLQRLRDVAAMVDPDRPGDAEIASTILADIFEQPVTPASAVVVAPAVEAVRTDTVPASALNAAQQEVARLNAENADLRAQLRAVPVPAVTAAVAVPEAKTTGAHAAQIIDSVETWTQTALDMDTKQRAALTASIKVLEMKNGSQPS